MASCLPTSVGAIHQQTPQQPGVYLLQVLPGTGQQKDWNRLFPLRVIKALSVGQITLSLIAFVSQLVLMTTSHVTNATAGFSGIWTGIFFGIAGGLGLMASTKPGKCSIIGFMVMSIIAALMAIPLLTFAMIGLIETQNCLRHMQEDTSYTRYWCPPDAFTSAVFDAILCFVAVCEGVMAIVSSAICCKVSCCGNKTKFQSSSAVYIAHPANSDQHAGNSGDTFSSAPPPQMVSMPAGAQAMGPPPAYQEKERAMMAAVTQTTP